MKEVSAEKTQEELEAAQVSLKEREEELNSAKEALSAMELKVKNLQEEKHAMELEHAKRYNILEAEMLKRKSDHSSLAKDVENSRLPGYAYSWKTAEVFGKAAGGEIAVEEVVVPEDVNIDNKATT
ncbi:hypothetical protein LIER_08515 [Lithospermum erythrorhizon]|uniref:Uncharacterized protein n=1 Tax=Lithospermum erythrorhizon TaxID=34254 RepID=A0AAV3PF18_LITER